MADSRPVAVRLGEGDGLAGRLVNQGGDDRLGNKVLGGGCRSCI
jgi:hypothetical protein